MPSYTVRVTKDYLVFSAGHFITLEGDICERVHGHNWRVALEAEGELNMHGYVVDFIALLDMGREIALRLDHRMLLPDGSGLIKITDDGANWRVTFGDRFWSFPKNECVRLPISNTTTEHIASCIGNELVASMKFRKIDMPRELRVELEENVGQSVWVKWRWEEFQSK